MKIKKVLKIIGIILAITIVIILIHSIRNFIIIKEIQKNIGKYENSTNYHIKSIAHETVGTTMKIDYYNKDNKSVTFMERTNSEGTIKVAMYNNGQKVDVFTESKEGKTCRLGAGNGTPRIELVNYFNTDNDWTTFFVGMFASIKEEKCNQKECYVVSNFKSPELLNDNEKNEIYIEKDTGLCLKNVIGAQETEREYEFNNVQESIFIEPDLGQYKILEN